MLRPILIAISLATTSACFAQDAEFTLDIRGHRFEPAELRVPAGKKIRLTVRNNDDTPEEFESHPLNREKVVPAKGKVLIFIGPLAAGRYPYFGEFNPKTAVGTIVAE